MEETNSQTTQQMQEQQQEQNISKSRLLMVFIVLCVIMVLVFVYILLAKTQKPSAQPTPKATLSYPTITPTDETGEVNNVNIQDSEIDLNDLQSDLQAL